MHGKTGGDNLVYRYYYTHPRQVPGNANGLGLPTWKPLNEGETPCVMNNGVNTRLESFQHCGRYLLLDRLVN
ncbi:MAG: hypothetical protein PVI44_03265 [Balneolaceae bacterium]